MTYPVPANEGQRLEALRGLDILHGPSPSMDRLCHLACEIFSFPTAIVSFLDDEQRWLKAECGYGGNAGPIPRRQAFCAYTILHDEIFVVPDARADARFRDNPLVAADGGIRFYAGVPLSISPGIRVGALCLIDTRTRDFTDDQASLLKQFARLVVDEIWLHHLVTKGFAAGTFFEDVELDFTMMPKITGSQLRAARAMLGWSIETVACAASVSVNTVKRAESADGPAPVRLDTINAIAQALSAGGVDWVFSAGHPPGVRPQKM